MPLLAAKTKLEEPPGPGDDGAGIYLFMCFHFHGESTA